METHMAIHTKIHMAINISIIHMAEHHVNHKEDLMARR